MKNYFILYTNGDMDFVEARKDSTAYNKACKMARENETGLQYLAETFDDTEEDRIVYER